MQWSKWQEAIFEWFEHGTGDAVFVALAGVGKTTVVIEGARRAPESRIWMTAFGKDAATTLQEKAKNSRVDARTFHSMGARYCGRFRPNSRIVPGPERLAGLARAACGLAAPDECVALVAKAIGYGREMAPLAGKLSPAEEAHCRLLLEHGKSLPAGIRRTAAGLSRDGGWRELVDIVCDFELEPADHWAEDFGDAETVARMAYKGMELALQPSPTIDFGDMLYLPVRLGWVKPIYGLVIVDEAQDMNLAQLLMAEMACAGRLAVVGDPHQAIYGFRGADSGSLARLKAARKAQEFSLPVTYRCPRAVVEEARAFVPEYEAAEANPEGIVRDLAEIDLLGEVRPGDAILSRKNADLVAVALKLIRAGRPARVLGRDIAEGLRALLKELRKGAARDSVPALLTRIAGWLERQKARIEASTPDREKAAARLAGAADKAETLTVIAEGAASVAEIELRITQLFEAIKTGTAVICASVHKAKGLEWERVYLLDWTFREGGEEDNIRYVAITRAMAELVYVLR